MAKDSRVLDIVDPPAERAMVFICEKCGKRADGDHNPSYELASRIKRMAKREFEKGGVRAVLTSCMKLCPDDRIAISIAPSGGKPSIFVEARYEDIDATCEAVLNTIRRTADTREPVF